MKVTVLDSSEKLLDAVSGLFQWADHVDMAYAWAASSAGQAKHWRSLKLGKIQRAVIGTQFAQTEPWALRKLDEKPGRLRVAITSTGTFHPKLLLGRKGNAVRAVMGSANFTSAAFSQNVELNIEMKGEAHHPEIKRLLAFMDDVWNDASEPKEDWMARYEEAWKKRLISTVVVPGAKLDVIGPTSLQMSWDGYFDLIQQQENRPLSQGGQISVLGPGGTYEAELDRISHAFSSGLEFAKLPDDQRKLIAGIGPLSNGFLGTMRAAGWAKEIINDEPEKVGEYLDQLPLSGEINIDQATLVVEGLTSLHGVNIGVASRLLAAKRPDVFVSVNGGSSGELGRLLGRDRKTVWNAKRYLELLGVIWATQWYRSPEPAEDRQRRVWRRRAAMLDAALYEAG